MKSRFVSLRAASVVLALPLMAMSTSAFAATQPVHRSSASAQTTQRPKADSTLTADKFASTFTTASTTNGTLTNSQIGQAITVANEYETVGVGGAVSVSSTTLAQNGLSSAQIQWVQSKMASFDQEVQNGTVPAPVSNAAIPSGLLATIPGSAPTGMASPLSTGGMAYSWYVSNNPYYLSLSRWYGTLYVMNRGGTARLLDAVNAISTGISLGSAVAEFIPFAQGVGLVGGLIGALGSTAAAVVNQVNQNGGNFGVNFPAVGGAIPVNVSANDPY